VTLVTISSHGSVILRGSYDGIARLCDAKTGETMKILSGHQALITSVAMSAVAVIVTGSYDGTARLWDAKTGHQVKILSGHQGPVRSVAISSDGVMILTGSKDRTARLWDAKTGEEMKILSGHEASVLAVAISSGGTVILTGSKDGTARRWDAKTGQEMKLLSGHQDAVTSVAISLDETMLLTGSNDRTVRLWDARTGQEMKILFGHQAPVISVAISSDTAVILTGSDDQTARLWDTKTGQEMRILSGHKSPVTSVAISSDAAVILTGSYDQTAQLWDSKTGQEMKFLSGHHAQVTSAAISLDGAVIMTGSDDNIVRLWDAKTGQETMILSGHHATVTSVAISSDGTMILTGSYDGTARLWHAKTGKEIQSLCGHRGLVRSVAISSDGALILTGSTDSTARLWDTKTGGEMNIFSGHQDAVTSVAISLDGTVIVTGSNDRTARLWDAKTGEQVKILSGHQHSVTSVAISSDGTAVLTGSDGRTGRLWDTKTGRAIKIISGHQDAITSVAFSSDGAVLLTGSKDRTARLWDAKTGQEMKILSGHEDVVTSVAISSDGGVILTGSKDRTARLWINVYSEDRLTRVFNPSIPPCPAEIEKAFEEELKQAKKSLKYQWPRFRGKAESLRSCLLYDTHRAYDEQVSYNILHVAVQHDYVQEFLHLMLSVMPHAALPCREGKMPNKGIEKQSLLKRAVLFKNSASIRVVLEVLGEFLRCPGEHDKRRFVPDASPLLPFLGDDELMGAQTNPHCADSICVNEICDVADENPELFVAFVRNLSLVRNYAFLYLENAARINLHGDYIMAGSNERSPFPADFTRVDASADSILITEVEEHEAAEVLKAPSFWARQAALRNPSSTKRTHVSPWLVPLKSIAGINSRFLATLVTSAEQLRDYRAFDNEVVKIVVEFKWKAFVRRAFLFDFAVFGALVVLFATHALVFDSYAREAPATGKAFGILILAIIFGLVFYLCYHEYLQARVLYDDLSEKHAEPDMNNLFSAIRIYLRDGWNKLHVTGYLLLLASSLTHVVTLAQWNSATDEDFRIARILCAITMPVLATQTLYYFSGLMGYGKLVRMILKITSGVIHFCVILFTIIAAFSASFMLLFKDIGSLDLDYNGYTRYDKALMTVYTFLFAGFSVKDLTQSTSPPLAIFLLALFLFVVVIVLLNLLIAIMGDKYDEVQEHAGAEAYYGLAKLVQEYEELIPRSVKAYHENDWYPTWIQVLKKDHEKSGRVETSHTWTGRVKAIKEVVDARLSELSSAIAKENATVKDQLKSLSSETTSMEERFKKAMEDRLAEMAVRQQGVTENVVRQQQEMLAKVEEILKHVREQS
jgi:WD40 repeat protein